MYNIKLSLFLILLFSSNFAVAEEFCDSTSNKCAEVGSGAAWLLSIIETSKGICPSSIEVNSWLEDNSWLIKKIKSEEPEYAYFLEIQSNSFWKTGNPEIQESCIKVRELVQKEHPLNSSLR